jgi:hypothetical protein
MASLITGLSMISGAAFAQTTGTVGLDYARADYGGGDTDAFGASGGVSIPTSGNLAVLLDASYSTNDDADLDVLAGSAHLINRNDMRAFGGWVGLAHADSSGGDADAWGLGGEYAQFFGQSTLVGSLGYATDDDNDVDVWGFSGEYRIFASENLRFDIGAGWANIDDGISDDDGTFIGAGVEYRFANSPFSIGASYSNVDLGGGGDADVIGATLRMDFGNDSLLSRDRTGNTFGAFGGLGRFLQ